MRIKRRTKRFFWRVLISIPVILVGGFLYLYFRPPSSAPPAQITVDMSPDRIEHGRYLFTTLCNCDGCHSERDFSRLGGPVVEAGRGKGGAMALEDLAGKILAPNITPDKETGIGTWTDGEKIRAIREGIGKDGSALFPLMPYTNYRYMSDDDVQALVAYLNTLPPVRNSPPKTQITFPTSMLIKSVPAPVGHKIPPVDPDGGEIYGEYLAKLARCEECHTPLVRGEPDPSMRFAGGRVFATQYGTVVSANITPDQQTGLGKWDFLRFQDRIKSYRQYLTIEPPKAGPDRFTLMPWLAYARLTDHDLEALFLYIKSRTPISHRVNPHPGYPE
ncbi:MAG: cytochrome C [Acidobacteria bacterium]|nr:MAG: cytochrome C [Acidobacteriota bacterium]